MVSTAGEVSLFHQKNFGGFFDLFGVCFARERLFGMKFMGGDLIAASSIDACSLVEHDDQHAVFERFCRYRVQWYEVPPPVSSGHQPPFLLVC